MCAYYTDVSAAEYHKAVSSSANIPPYVCRVCHSGWRQLTDTSSAEYQSVGSQRNNTNELLTRTLYLPIKLDQFIQIYRIWKTGHNVRWQDHLLSFHKLYLSSFERFRHLGYSESSGVSDLAILRLDASATWLLVTLPVGN